MAKCSECGLLCGRDTATGELKHVDVATRQSGKFPPHRSAPDGKRWYSERPTCFVLAAVLDDPDQSPEPDVVLGIINADRDCPRFTPWRHGFTPKEHAEMLQMNEMRQWQERMADENKRHNSRCALIQGGATILAALTSVFLSAIFAYVMSRK